MNAKEIIQNKIKVLSKQLATHRASKHQVDAMACHLQIAILTEVLKELNDAAR